MKLPFSVIKNDIHKGYKYLDYGEITILANVPYFNLRK
mgnify:CR=1 FL=1